MVPVLKEMLDRAKAVPVRTVIRAINTPIEIFLFRVIQLTPVLMRYLAHGRRSPRNPDPFAQFRLATVQFLCFCEATRRASSVAHCRGRRCQEAVIRSCY